MKMEAIDAETEETIKMIKSFVGPVITESEILETLSQCENRVDLAVFRIVEKYPQGLVRKTVTGTGVRISAQGNEDKGEKTKGPEVFDGENVKMPRGMDCDSGVSDMNIDNEMSKGLVGQSGLNFGDPFVVEKRDNVGMCIVKKPNEVRNKAILNEEGSKVPARVKRENGDGTIVKEENCEESDMVLEEKQCFQDEKSNLDGKVPCGLIAGSRLGLSFEEWLKLPENCPQVKEESSQEVEKSHLFAKVKEEPNVGGDSYSEVWSIVKHEALDHGIPAKPDMRNDFKGLSKEAKEIVCVQPLSARPIPDEEYRRTQMGSTIRQSLGIQKHSKVEDKMLSTVVIEDGDFPEEADWLLVGRNVILGLSTTKGRRIENNEIVHIAFPSGNMSHKSGIVRFSTKRNGEIGRLPMEWSKCLTPLVNSSKVKVLGRCISAPTSLHLMQEIMLYVSFYIHHSVFTEINNSSWKLEPSNIDSTTYPLLTLFKLLKIKPFQEAEFTPEELDSRKRSLKLADDLDGSVPMLPLAKRIKGCSKLPPQNEEEQAIPESSLNNLVGAADMYDLKEMEPPSTLMCDLRPYQKQALFWMTELEKGVDVEEAAKTLHPCWGAYRICDERASAIYVNIFSGEATTQLPTATQMARGGILADAMGLGKTVMTIALILARRGRGTADGQELITDSTDDTEYMKKKKIESDKKFARKVKGGTLIVCPMALLGQWKDELETHSMPDSLSVSVFYGGDRSDDPSVIALPDVILTTYGVLMAAFKNDEENSIFHQVEWYRVVLDEAHTIKSSRTICAQAAFKLSSYCRWCLTGTPLQNKLEDLYSLLCFLHVEPWCNWAWWQKLVQKPYESGDQRGMKLVKAILRPLMLRRTKDSKDKEGRPILVLPPTDIKLIECEQSETEYDFYDALFKRSKVQFDQFVAQGKVLHNYANILELLLRLRQCCNHPFLVMSRGDTQNYADLNKLAKRFLETNPDSATQKVPSRAYVEEVVEGIRKGENTECPICLESADDPVLTPCAHRMCRECLLSSWRGPAAGLCPICRQLLKKTELITCPSESRFRIDVEKNWKESSKVSKLLDCLEGIRSSGSGDKSIVFSQWTSFLDLLEIPLKRRKIGFLRFDGKLSQKQREVVLREFNDTEEKMVLLMSLKAGGVGLNLTAASNVFLMDPWWNPAVEDQAIMRIHRIGQKRTVRVRRFIVKGTVEERLQQVQARKQRMIAGALTDEEVRSARIEELKMLFR